MSERTLISVIGLRAYPGDFVGTSGVEVYVENILSKLLDIEPKYSFIIYTRKKYQNILSRTSNTRIKLVPLLTLNSKVWETVVYSLIASIYACFDGSIIVWYHGIGPAMWLWLPKILGKKVVVTLHSLDWLRRKWLWWEKNVFRFIAEGVISWKPTFTVVSQNLKNILYQNYSLQSHFTPPGLLTIPKNLNLKILSKFKLKKNQYLLFLGRIVPEKRIELLHEVFFKLKHVYPNLKLVICGGSGNYPTYEDQLKQNYLNEGTIWTGYILGKEKYSLLKNAKAFVLSSEFEGMPLSLLEALSLKKFCILPDLDQFKKFANLNNIFLFKKNNLESLKKACVKVLKIKNDSFSTYQDSIFEKYNWHKTALKYLSIFNNVI